MIKNSINATLIRRQILRGGVWSHLVPSGTVEVVEDVHDV